MVQLILEALVAANSECGKYLVTAIPKLPGIVSFLQEFKSSHD
jgi:hypothetical protein